MPVAASGDTAIIGAYGNDAYHIFSHTFNIATPSAPEHKAEMPFLDIGEGGNTTYFSSSASIYGTQALIGVYGTDFGAGLLYDISNPAIPVQQAALVPTGTPLYDLVGADVALYGDYALVGAPGTDANGLTDSGAVYYFDVNIPTTLNQVAALTVPEPDAKPFDMIGSEVALYSNWAFVGAPDADSGDGAVYIFDLNAAYGTPPTKISAPAGAAGFGSSLSLSDSGNILLIGSPKSNNNKGTAYLYNITVRSNPSWMVELTAPDGASNDQFGWSAVIFSSGIFIGAPGDDNNAGSVYQFDGFSGTPNFDQKIISNSPAENNFFGMSIAAANAPGPPGITLLVGAPGTNNDEGAVELFNISSSTSAGYQSTISSWENEPYCSAASQGSGANGSPFMVNHRPQLSGIDISPSAPKEGETPIFTALVSDNDVNPTRDNVRLLVCTTPDPGASLDCGNPAQKICESQPASGDPNILPRPYCPRSFAITQAEIDDFVANGNTPHYYGFVYDEHNLAHGVSPYDILIPLTPNTAPIVNITQGLPSSIVLNKVYTIKASIIDPDAGDVHSCYWSIDEPASGAGATIDATADPCNTTDGSEIKFKATVAGKYRLKFRAFDQIEYSDYVYTPVDGSGNPTTSRTLPSWIEVKP